MALSQEELGLLRSNDGYIIDLDGEETPVGPGFAYGSLEEVFYSLIEEKGVEATADAIGFFDGKEMVDALAKYVDDNDEDADMADFILEYCNGKRVNDRDCEAEAADHKADELAGR